LRPNRKLAAICSSEQRGKLLATGGGESAYNWSSAAATQSQKVPGRSGMQPGEKLNETRQNSGDQGDVKVCPQCGAPMPGDMRFCRSCGQRLGEGPAEYTETVRFANGTAPPNGRWTSPFTPGVHAPIAQQSFGTARRRRRLGFTGMTWIWIALALFFASGGVMSLFRRGSNFRPLRASVTANRSYFGIDGFESTNGGATFKAVTPPGGPADKAGLIGGDIITSFDGRIVKDEDDMMAALRQTPIGKTVEVIYLRDGETKKTQMTTISNGELDQLEGAYSGRPEGRGLFGYDNRNTELVLVPGTNTYGVRLNEIEPNRPADIAGIRNGDIVVEFDNIPIRTEEEFLARVRRALPRSTVTVVVMRDGQRIEIPVRIGKA
jgi:hypothetical protein